MLRNGPTKGVTPTEIVNVPQTILAFTNNHQLGTVELQIKNAVLVRYGLRYQIYLQVLYDTDDYNHKEFNRTLQSIYSNKQ